MVIESWKLCQNVWSSFGSLEVKLDQEFSQDSMTSHSCAICSKSQKIVKVKKIMAQFFLNFESTCDLTDVQASMYERKTAARPFDTIHDILRSLSLVQSLLKGRNMPI